MRGTLAQLSNHIGRYLMDHNLDKTHAEDYLRLAVVLSDGIPNPDFYTDLADYYVNNGQNKQLDELSEEFEGLSENKSGGIKKMPLDKVFRFHLAVGSMYRYLKQWKNNRSPVASANFQIKQAVKTAVKLNNQALIKPTDRNGEKLATVTVAPEIIQELIQIHRQKGDVSEAEEIRSLANEHYLLLGKSPVNFD